MNIPELFQVLAMGPRYSKLQIAYTCWLSHTNPITSLFFNPSSRKGPIAITTPQDKTFKVWNLNSNQSNTDATWICRSVGVYRNSEAKVAAFSEDGSMLAVRFGQTITFGIPIWIRFKLTQNRLKVWAFWATIVHLGSQSQSHTCLFGTYWLVRSGGIARFQ